MSKKGEGYAPGAEFRELALDLKQVSVTAMFILFMFLEFLVFLTEGLSIHNHNRNSPTLNAWGLSDCNFASLCHRIRGSNSKKVTTSTSATQGLINPLPQKHNSVSHAQMFDYQTLPYRHLIEPRQVRNVLKEALHYLLDPTQVQVLSHR